MTAPRTTRKFRRSRGPAAALTAAAAAGSLLLAACGSGGTATAASEGPIKIGLLATLTGASAADGLGAQRGAELAIKELNARGGFRGRTFELKSADTKNESNDTVTAGVQDLQSDEAVKAVVSGYASTTNFEINNFARSKTIYLIGGSTAQTEAIVKPDPSKFPTIWSVTPSYDAYGTGPVDVLAQWTGDGSYTPRTKTAYIVTSDNPYSQGISTGMSEALADKGWTVVRNQTIPFGPVNDWGSVLADVRAKNPDLIVNTDYQVSNEIAFLRQFLQNPTQSLMFLQYGPNQPEFAKAAGADGDGVLFNNLAGTVTSPAYEPAQALTKAYQAAYGTDQVDPQAVITYESVMIYAAALEKVGDPDKTTEVGAAIGASTTQSAGGTISFDPATHLAKQGDDFVPLQSYQMQNQQKVLIAPAKYATGKFVLPPWMKK
ncbi:ABC transporter substrate-binding protein [Pseudonocardia kujensis]|uniref:ABC transporter substrate-binding protein n=1 Tax=Pseudonocardia kujensis TaxID=1128675 RepID=UPI001E62CA33|nr:ABC transporter substrate-binding protein [Pseudonocardia kujensis]MCE0768084.1 ABC transporter substrate-binding protein [Pseudonocardia kujensis]